MANVDRSQVAGLPVFAGLAPGELDELLREARTVRFPKGSTVFSQDEEAHSFFVLLNGHVRAVKLTPAGQQIVVRYVGPGELFGIAPAIGSSTYPATAIAASESLALAWRSAAWPRLIARYPSLAGTALQTVGSRLQEAHTRVIEMTTEQVEQRVARALLRLAQQAGKKVDEGVQIDFPITRQDVAEMIGTTLHTVSRILSAWEDQGLVEGGRQRIVIRDPHKLVMLAEKPSE
ncbi:Crp/Fnr family transcriptional regulator [Desertibaculum subflavum]|uniref:Crp/Fnr family transcriptional regulator n=1 Tax=Desertibaculum subflavum TaxID=2268458 RepID=UPI000E672963